MVDNTYTTPVGRLQGATEIFIDAGGTLNAASGKVILPPNLKRGYIPLDLFSARALSSGEAILGASVSATGGNLGNAIGGLLNANSTPTLTMNSTLNQAAVLTWASGVVTAIAFPPVLIPPDFSSAGGLTIHGHAERASDNASNNVLDFRFWANTNATEQGTTGSTMTTTPAEYNITVSSAEAGAHPGFWNVQIAPGTHTNNAVRLFGAGIEYDRKTS